MHRTLQRTVLAVLLIGGIALAFAYRNQLDVETPEARVAESGFIEVLIVRRGVTTWLEHGWPTQRGPEQLETLP